MRVVLDFETYFDKQYSLKIQQLDTYVTDQKFKIHGYALKIDQAETEWHVNENALQNINWDEAVVVCQNAYFDCFILSQHYDIRPHFIRDTMSMNRALFGADSVSSLKELAKLVGMEKGDELESIEAIRQPKPELLAKIGKYSINDVNITAALDDLFTPRMPESELRLIDLTVRMFTEPVLRFNKERLIKHLTEVIAHKKAKADKVKFVLDYFRSFSFIPYGEDEDYEDIKSALVSDDSFAKVLISLGVNIPSKISQRTGKETTAFSKNDVEFKELLDHPNQKVKDVVEARLILKSALEETRTERFINKSHRPWSPMYIYLGAHTMRWSGGNNENPQNLTRGSELRLAIEAQPGYVLGVCDSSQIEARINAHLAGQTDLIDVFKEGKDPYVHMGRSLYPHLAHLSDSEFKKHHKNERQISKIVVLGAGYQMSSKKFRDFAKTVGGLSFTQTQADTIIKTYRQVNHKIARQWYTFHDLLDRMVRGDYIPYGPIAFDGNKIFMPNGLYLYYPDMSKDDAGHYCYRRKHGKKERIYLYGGILVENVVQCLARIVVAEQMLLIAKRYRIVMITHDEVVAYIREEEADEAIEYMINCMNTPPSWWPDLPVASEGGYAFNYSK